MIQIEDVRLAAIFKELDAQRSNALDRVAILSADIAELSAALNKAHEELQTQEKARKLAEEEIQKAVVASDLADLQAKATAENYGADAASVVVP